MQHSKKIQNAWGKDYSKVQHDTDEHGWYNGSSDRDRKEFSVEVVWVNSHARPVTLTEGYKKPAKEEKQE